MKKKLLTKAIVYLTVSVFSLTYLFLIPFARIRATYAQDINVPKPSQAPHVQKTVSKVYVPTGASSTILKTSDGEQALLIQDHLTSTRVVETSGGSKPQEYYPYGTTKGEANTTTDKQFTSHRSLADTGVYHAGARFYNPQLGLFVSADKVQGPNRYMYAMGNPTTYNDPSGKIIPIIIAAIIIGGAAFGAGFGAGYEQQSQVNQYGSVKEPAQVVAAGVAGGAVGAGVGYMGAVAVPAAIGAISTGVGATSAVGLVGGAQIGTAACLNSPGCIDAIEMTASVTTRSDLPPNWNALPRVALQPDLDAHLAWLNREGNQFGLSQPFNIPPEHLGSPDEMITVFKGLRVYAAGRDILPSISKQSWLYGHEGDTGALIGDRVAAQLARGSTMEQIISEQAWNQAVFPGDANYGTSWTTDYNVAAKYGKGGGIAAMTVPRSKLVSIPQLAAARGEWPAAQCPWEAEMYHFGIVKKEDYTVIARGWSE